MKKLSYKKMADTIIAQRKEQTHPGAAGRNDRNPQRDDQ